MNNSNIAMQLEAELVKAAIAHYEAESAKLKTILTHRSSMRGLITTHDENVQKAKIEHEAELAEMRARYNQARSVSRDPRAVFAALEAKMR